MRSIAAGLVCGTVILTLVISACWENTGAYAQGYNRHSSGSLISFDSTGSDGQRQIVVVDSQRHVLGVYHVDATTGSISLQSIRNISWDLRLDEFSAGSPPLEEVRAMVERR